MFFMCKNHLSKSMESLVILLRFLYNKLLQLLTTFHFKNCYTECTAQCIFNTVCKLSLSELFKYDNLLEK